MSLLFRPLTVRSVTLPNRIGVSPMCQYSAEDGVPTDWHLVHLGSRAIGGAGLVFAEATAVQARGRISPHDAGIWSGRQVDAWRPVTAFVREHGAVPAAQLAHAGFKASTHRPFDSEHGALSEGGWPVAGATDVPFSGTYPVPVALDESGIREITEAFAASAARAVDAGFRAVEIHAAHGYLLHEFLSPITNTRTDGYGGDFDGRSRFAVEVTEAVRSAVGPDVPVFVRISATDWVPGGWTVADSVTLAGKLRVAGADVIDCSSGGIVPRADIPVGPGYQVSLAETVRHKADVLTAAVGMITEPEQAESIIADGAADLVLLGRQLLRDPYWPQHAARTLGAEVPRPIQYARA